MKRNGTEQKKLEREGPAGAAELTGKGIQGESGTTEQRDDIAIHHYNIPPLQEAFVTSGVISPRLQILAWVCYVCIT